MFLFEIGFTPIYARSLEKGEITWISKPKRDAGEEVHSSEFKKHKKAVLWIIVEMEVERTEGLPAAVLKDITDFISRLENDPFDVNTLIILQP